LEKGQEVSHYVITKKLGAGGMGEVYLARDTQLDRTVALKILPADVASDKRRMQRFKQEARIASTLNQPNIVTIFEFNETDSLSFIATEYVDGETLRHHLRGRRVTLAEIIDISNQILAALDAAHEAKIVHRDIKPENVMIRRRDGVVKVLDFGLAKLTEKKTGSVSDTEAATEVLMKTMPGSVMGTVSYMSPEQAQGLTVDNRTDLWSTGVIIYEMIAGRPPFAGATSSHIVVEILEKDPRPLARVSSLRVPDELQRIVSKALSKNPDERYQTAKDMLIDLRSLKRRLDINAEIERSASPDTVGARSTTDRSALAHETDSQPPAAGTQVEERAPRKRVVIGVLLTAMVVVAALAFGVNLWRSSPAKTFVSPPSPVERQLNYWMMVQKYRDGKPYMEPFRLAREVNFEKDYRVRLNVSSPQAGYLYILNEGPEATDGAPSIVVLFPSPTANGGSSFLAENEPVQIPQQGWFQFDQEEGTEKLWLVFSANTEPELEAVKGFANAKDRGAINDLVLGRRVREFLKTHLAAKTTLENNDGRKQTTIKAQGDLLVQLISLEHH
jgi:serine/threonine protein kinase